MIFDLFKALSEDAQRLLCIYAYNGMGSQKGIKEYHKSIKKLFPGYEGNAALSELEEHGMMKKSLYSWYYNTYLYDIERDFFVSALWYMIEERADLYEAFKSLKLTPTMTHSVVRNAVYQICQSEYTSCPNALSLSANDIQYFYAVGNARIFAPIFNNLTKSTFTAFLSGLVDYMLEYDLVDDGQYLHQLIKDNQHLSAADRISLTSYAEIYDYLANGVLPEHHVNAADCPGLTMAAIHRVLKGEYKEAIKVFQMALKIQNKNSSIKNLYTNYLYNYFLVLAYAHDNTEESKTKLRQFLNKQVIQEYISLLPSRIIACQATNFDKEWHESALINIFNQSCRLQISLVYAYMAYLLASYLGFKCASQMKFKSPVPNLLILQHEMQKYIPLSDEQRERLASSYGDKPALTSIYHKSDWELVIENLTIANNTEQKEEERTTRLAYIVRSSYTDDIEVREQTRLKNGEWGSGKAISMSRYTNGDIDYMDENDRKILDDFKRSYSYAVKLEHVVPYMAGCDRLYYGSYAPFTPVKVTEEKPYLVVEKTDRGFKVKSNIRSSESDEKIIIRRNSASHISFIHLSDTQRPYYMQLLKLGTFPPEAEEALRSFLPRIGGTVEVHSDLIEGGSTLRTVDGSTMARVQIRPQKDGYYTVNIAAHPLPRGDRDFPLGKGEDRFIDEADGERVWVMRHLKEEKKVAKMLTTFFKSFTDEEHGVEYYEPDVMLDPEMNPELTPDLMLPLIDFIQQHPKQIYAEWPEGKSVRMRHSSSNGSWSGSLNARGSWFELEGDIQIDEDTVLTMSELLDLVANSKSRYVQLGEGEFLALSEALHRQLKALESASSRERGKLHISPFSAALLSNDVFDGEIRIGLTNDLVALRRKIAESENYKPEVPKELQATLRPYQLDGYQWMARLNSWGAGALLADDMGLGKTIQTIAFLLLKAGEGASLVIAPASVAPNWKTELQRFAPALNTIVLNFESDRQKAIEQAGPGDVIITTYGLLLTEQDSINARKWNIACLDEAHIIKNRGAKTSAAAMKIQAANRVILTGTPVQNHLSELWSLFQFINPGLLGTFEDFGRRYIAQIERDHDMEAQQRLDQRVHPFMLRRTKNSVLKELPDKTEIYQKIELSTEEMAIYEVIRQKAEMMLEETPLDKVDINVLAEITRLRQAACSASLVEKKWKGTTSKVTALLELLQEVIEGENRALVFSQFTSFLTIVRKALDAAGIPYYYIDGAVPVKKRTQLVKQFQDGGKDSASIFIISLKAGGLGLNLTGANYVFHLDPWWNPAIEQQATDRAYRIGQNQAVTVYHLIAQGTIEEKIVRLHEQKRELAENILDGTDLSHKLTGKELLDMVKR